MLPPPLFAPRQSEPPPPPPQDYEDSFEAEDDEDESAARGLQQARRVAAQMRASKPPSRYTNILSQGWVQQDSITSSSEDELKEQPPASSFTKKNKPESPVVVAADERPTPPLSSSALTQPLIVRRGEAPSEDEVSEPYAPPSRKGRPSHHRRTQSLTESGMPVLPPAELTDALADSLITESLDLALEVRERKRERLQGMSDEDESSSRSLSPSPSASAEAPSSLLATVTSTMKEPSTTSSSITYTGAAPLSPGMPSALPRSVIPVKSSAEFITTYISEVLATVPMEELLTGVSISVKDVFLVLEHTKRGTENQQIFNKALFDSINEALPLALAMQRLPPSSSSSATTTSASSSIPHMTKEEIIYNVCTQVLSWVNESEKSVEALLIEDALANENEWVSFESDEAQVKAEVGDVIFQEILADTSHFLYSLSGRARYLPLSSLVDA